MNRYNLDIIISVGTRVNVKKATQFLRWATQRLKDFLAEGYAINEKRLAESGKKIQLIEQVGNLSQEQIILPCRPFKGVLHQLRRWRNKSRRRQNTPLAL